MSAFRPCGGCVFWKTLVLENVHKDRCFRPRLLRGGETLEASSQGFDALHERDGFPEPHRIKGDKCGPSGSHWKAAP